MSVEPQTHLGSRRARMQEASAVALNPVTGVGVLTQRGHKETHRHRGDRDTEKKGAMETQRLELCCHKPRSTEG